mgnify:CR=1 FL=1
MDSQTMYEMYPEWGPAKNNPDSPTYAGAVQTARAGAGGSVQDVREVADPGIGVDVGLGQDLLRGGQADPEDVGEGDLDPLLAGDVDAGDACR